MSSTSGHRLVVDLIPLAPTRRFTSVLSDSDSSGLTVFGNCVGQKQEILCCKVFEADSHANGYCL